MNASVTQAQRRRGFVGFLRTAAEAFFELCGKVVEAYDSLPLEQKHGVKTLLVKGLPQRRTDFETQALFGEELELAKILSEHEWWVLERDITGPIQRDLLRLGRGATRAELDQYLCRLFSDDRFSRLERKVAAWFDIPYLSARQDMIMQCLVAHKEGRFYLSTCTLLPLLDGLTRSFRREVLGRGNVKPAAGRPRPRTIEMMLVTGYYLRRTPALWGRPFSQFVDKRVYGKFRFGSEVAPSSLNRHGILHGEIADYGSQTNSLKVFLLVDTIQHFYREVQRQKAARLRQRAARLAAPPQLAS